MTCTSRSKTERWRAHRIGSPQRLREQPHRSFAGRGQTSEFQSVVVTAKIGELVSLFGRYVKYLVQSPAESEVGPSSSVHSLFEVMMAARKVVRLPLAMAGSLSKKDELYNHMRA